VKSGLGGFLPAFLTAVLCAAGAHKAPDEKLAPESECAKLQPELERAQAQWEKTDARFAQVDWTI
jgi:hypothetical protein